MIYGNSKNTTFTQSTYNCNAAVGFFFAMILRSFYPNALVTNWYWYVLSAEDQWSLDARIVSEKIMQDVRKLNPKIKLNQEQ